MTACTHTLTDVMCVGFLNCAKNTCYEIFPLNKHLSVQNNIVSYRDNVVPQISRMCSSLYLLISNPLYPFPLALGNHHSIL